jgi:hypothetical protein
MTPNELLAWLSARKEGSWPQFRGAVENLGLEGSAGEAGEDTSLPLHQRVRFNLERLGHVEFDTEECENGWRVVPPALALCQHDAAVTAVLCGARSLPLLKRIEGSASGMQIDQIPLPDCPDIIRIQSANAQDLEKLGQREGLLCQPDAPEALLSGLPPVSYAKKWPRQALPTGGKDWEVKQLIIERRTMKWRSVTPQEANAPNAEGLFRFSRFQTPEYFLREGRETIKLPGAIGKYFVLFRYKRCVLRYNRQDRSLSVPALFRPPLLTERALILCSGMPPSLSVAYGRSRLTYRDIPEEVAGLAAEVLGQDLR